MTSQIERLALQERTRREILQRSDSITPLPDVVVRVLALLNAPDSEPAAIEQQIGCDQVLVAKMLGLVNSPFYGLAHSVRSIRDAIMVLGFRGLRSLLLASSAAEHLKLDYGIYGFEDRGLFKHSMVVGTAARELGKLLDFEPNVREELFISGLLHDIGKMLLLPHAQRRKSKLNGPLDCAAEEALIGMDHAEAGALVAAKWGLSEVVREVLRSHHIPSAVHESAHGRAIAVVRVVNALADQHRAGYRADAEIAHAPIEGELEVLGFDAASWAESRVLVEDAIDQAISESSHF